jgi:hypothetical protein
MYVAAQKGHVEVVIELEKMGSNPNTPNSVCGTKKDGVSKSAYSKNSNLCETFFSK